MADLYASAWAKIAADIAAEKRPAPKPQDTQANVVDTLKSELIKARLALAGITAEESTITAAAKRLTVSETGALIDPHSVGSGPNFTATLDDVIKDLGETASPNHGQGKTNEPNPFAKATWNLTAQMQLWRTDEAKAAHYEYLAAIGKN
jgi:hypothetical protein